MDPINKKTLSERDICTKYITPAIYQAGWDIHTQVREEVTFTNGRVIVQGLLVSRGRPKRADYILYYKPNIPIAVIEAKRNKYGVGGGMQQALNYAQMLDVPFVYSSNGDAFLQHDRTQTSGELEKEIPLHAFPSPEYLWKSYCAWKNIDDTKARIITQDYYTDGNQKTPRYYQLIAINRTIEAITRGQDRILLVMATGTGKTFTAFQIIWRLWKSRTKKRILFLADRNILVDQTRTNDFKPFGPAMTKIRKRQAGDTPLTTSPELPASQTFQRINMLMKVLKILKAWTCSGSSLSTSLALRWKLSISLAGRISISKPMASF